MTQDAPPSPGKAGRIAGWDLLRGCCAYAVVIYHMMTWQKVADVHTLGFYGVYLFFVLSGASLVVNYHSQFGQQLNFAAYGRFLFRRYMRLMPLFVLALLASYGIYRHTFWPFVLNISLLFGLSDPLATSRVIGGWSLGIEFVFYLAFPVFIWCLGNGQRDWRRWVVFAGLLALQFYWIGTTFALDGTSFASAVAYHQVPAFAAYFFGGCIIGWFYLNYPPAIHISGWQCGAGILLAVVVMAGLNTADPVAVLYGWRGGILTGLCFAMVAWAGLARFGPRGAYWARHLGDVTYGVYLIHPILYFHLTPALGPKGLWLYATSGVPSDALMIGAAVLVTSTVLAWLSENYVEKPIRRWSNRKI